MLAIFHSVCQQSMLCRSAFSVQRCLCPAYIKRSFAARFVSGPKAVEAGSEDEHREARVWLETYKVNSIPRNICEVTFSRASGPGGQNVNKYVGRS